MQTQNSPWEKPQNKTLNKIGANLLRGRSQFQRKRFLLDNKRQFNIECKQ